MTTTGVSFTSPTRSPLVSITKTATVGEIFPGWTIQEDATSNDILDTSGSTGNVSATFRRTNQSQADQTPNSGPNPSSEYLLDQFANFWHPTLGTLSGYITDTSFSEGSVDFDMATLLDSLNKDIYAPPFVEGSPFYSFTLAIGASVADILVDGAGDLWIALDNDYNVYKYTRFGVFISSVALGAVGTTVPVRKLGMDSSGNIYGLTSAGVNKYNVSTSTVSSVVAQNFSYSWMDFEVDAASGMMYIATGDTTAGAAIKKYNISGTLQTTWGTYTPDVNPHTPTPSTFFSTMSLGIDPFGSKIYVASVTYGSSGSGALPISNDVQAFSNVGVYQYTQNLSLTNLASIPYATSFEVTPTRGAASSILTGSTVGINLASDVGSSNIINGDYRMRYTNYGIGAANYKLAMGADPNGFGFYVGYGNTVTRFAGGKLSPYQALECYIGIGGINQVYKVVYTNLTTSQLNIFDGGYFPAWNGNLWAMLKQLAARSRFYITTSGSNINITSLTGVLPRLDITGHTPIDKRFETATGKMVNVTNISPVSTRASNVPLYQGNSSSSIISADYNEINTTTVQANSYPIYIDPLANLQGTNWDTTNVSSYMVCDSSNPPQILSTGQFVQAGGSVVATPSSAIGSIDITMTGPKVAIPGQWTGPFSLAYPVGSQKVSAITISGNGVVVNPSVISILTGASSSVTPSDQTQDITSPFISSASFAYDSANPVCTRLGQGEFTLNFSIPLSSSHTLGSIAGSIFLWERTKWRVASAKISNGMIDITAKRFTTIYDVTPNNPSMTVGQMDNLWNGYRVQDRYLSPGVVSQ